MIFQYYEEGKIRNLMDYEEMMTEMRKIAQSDSKDLDKRSKYIPLNYQRSVRIQKTYVVSQELREVVESIEQPQYWFIFTEYWCGDSAQTIPYITKIAALNSNIQLRMIPRDQNLEIMDQYLNQGKRRIPLLIAIDADGEELFRWGPRPQPAEELFRKGRAQDLPKDNILKQVHTWFAKDRGKSLEAEFFQILQKVTQTVSESI